MQKYIDKYSLQILGVFTLIFIVWLGYSLSVSRFEDSKIQFLSPVSQSDTGKNVLGTFKKDYEAVLINAPKQVEAETVVTFTWRIDGPETVIHHTSVQLGKISTPGMLGSDTKISDTKYTDKVTDFNYGNYNIPLQFVGNFKITDEGRYYYRVYAEIAGINYWSDEFNFDVIKSATAKTNGNYKITIVYPSKMTNFSILPKYDKEITGGGVMTFTWWVEGPPNSINFTTIYYGPSSNAGIIGDVKPTDTTYTDYVKDFTNGIYNIPLQFVGNTNIASSGTYYYRGYALINSRNYWTDEYVMNIE